MEVKVSEAQGQDCEVLSEGSVKQSCDLTNRNWIERQAQSDEWAKDHEVHIHQGLSL
jgi:hypothetical protein